MTTLDKIKAEIEQIKPYELPWDKRTPEHIRDMAVEIVEKYAEQAEDAYDKVLAYLKANVDDFPDYHEAIEAVLKMKGGE